MKLPLRAGITTAPLLGEGGSTRAVEGLDPKTRLRYVNVTVLKVPEKPTERQTEAAVQTLRSAFQLRRRVRSGNPGTAARRHPELTGEPRHIGHRFIGGATNGFSMALPELVRIIMPPASGSCLAVSASARSACAQRP